MGMEINETNRKIYESSFIQTGEYGFTENHWKPDIDEREIQEYCEDGDGNWTPATPLGYRNYNESRRLGIIGILNQEICVSLPGDSIHHIKRNECRIKKYDKIVADAGNFVVVGDDDDNFYVVNEENILYSVGYEKD